MDMFAYTRSLEQNITLFSMGGVDDIFRAEQVSGELCVCEITECESWRSLCGAGDQIRLVLNATDSCLFVDGAKTHKRRTLRDAAPREALGGHAAFPGFHRSSGESKDGLDHPKRSRRSTNNSPCCGLKPKHSPENIVFLACLSHYK